MFARMLNDFAPLWRLQDEVNRVFQRSLGDMPRFYSPTWPALNIWETDDSALVEAELPGLTMQDLEVTVAGNDLTISGDRKLGAHADDNGVNWHRRERAQGRFTRTVTLPWDIDPDKVEARLVDGVLTVQLPKAQQARAKKVKILTA